MKKAFSSKALDIREVCLESEKFLQSWLLSENIVGDLVLCIDEALTNIKLHGYKNSDEGRIWITIFRKGSRINIIIRDQAKPYSIEDYHAPNRETYLHSDQIGGFGVSIIRKLADSVKLLRINNENILWIAKETDICDVLLKNSNPAKIFTETADAFIENGILKIITKPGSTIRISDAVDHIEAYLNLVRQYPEQKAWAMLVNMKGMKMITSEARKYYTDQPQMDIAAIAIVINSVFGRWLANIFISFNKHDQEIRIFNSETEAIPWLESFNKNFDRNKSLLAN